MDIQRPINTVPFDGRLTAEMREHIMLRAREMQGEVTRTALASAWRHLTIFTRPLLARLGAWWQRYETERRLMALSDRMLADIGIAREAIPQLTRGIDPKTAPQTAGWLSDLRSRLAAVRRARAEWRRVCGELMRYSDRELDDLGIRRYDIPRLTRESVAAAA